MYFVHMSFFPIFLNYEHFFSQVEFYEEFLYFTRSLPIVWLSKQTRNRKKAEGKFHS